MEKQRSNGLYVAFHEVNPAAGVSQKILNQVEAFKHNGINMSLLCFKNNNCVREMVLDNEYVSTVGNGLRYLLNLHKVYSWIVEYVNNKDIQFLFIRYTQNADPLFLRFLKTCKRCHIKVLLEIPTYPYDGEFESQKTILKLQIKVEKCFRKYLYKYVDYVVTTSEYDTILGIPSIKLSNAVNKDKIPLKKEQNNSDCVLTLISVATISFWHGLDRLLRGLYDYKKENRDILVKLIIVGGGDSQEIDKIKTLINNLCISDIVEFCGPAYGEQLNMLYDKANMAVGCLACHRKNIKEVKSLKNVEYAMRGLPFFYSEDNTDFDDKPYVIKVPANDSNIIIDDIVNFYKSHSWNSQEIRASVKELTWDFQIKKVVDIILS